MVITPAAPVTRQQRLRDALFGIGFDIFHGPFSPVVYNDILESEGLVRSGLLSKLPEELRTTTANKTNTRATTAYLIGNTKHLWPVFLRWLHEENRSKQQELVAGDDDDHTDGERILIEDPLDTYEQSAIRDVVERVCGWNQKDENKMEDSSSEGMLYWSSDLDPARMVSMARIASCTGFSYLDPHTHLSVHPTFGTWHSYRAVLLLPEESSVSPCSEPPPFQTPTFLPNPVSPLEMRAAQEAFDMALETSTSPPKKATALTTLRENCGETTATREESSGIVREARSELSEELGRGNYNEEQDGQEASSLRKSRVATVWIALRDAISIGRETYRFDENQLWYHYTKDPSFLLNGIHNMTLQYGS
jgi:hypothetical protein